MPCPGVVMITGANRGIGFELVKQLIELPEPPVTVFATCRNPDKAQELQEYAAKHKIVQVVRLDVTSAESIAAAKHVIEGYLGERRLNLLINNAAIFLALSWEETGEEAMLTTYRTNTIGPLMVVKEFLPLIKRGISASVSPLSSDRAIVNISGHMGSIGLLGEGYLNNGSRYAYRCSKAALNMLTRCISLDLRDDGILVLSINPGWTQTDMGGPRATNTVKDTAVRVLGVIFQANDVSHGLFLDNRGGVIPW